jgi:hypothetical protein
MYTFYDARAALTEDFEIANGYSSELLDDVARWVVGQGSWILDLPMSTREADQWLTRNARKAIREYFDYISDNSVWTA